MKKNYLVLFLFCCFFSKAQIPGGTQNVQMEYWLKANQVSTIMPSDGADVLSWQDLSGNGRNFSAATTFYPKFTKSSMNFNSAVDFYFLDSDDGGPSSANNRRRQLISDQYFPVDTNKSYFVFWVSRVDQENTGTNGTVLAFSSTRNDNFGWMGGTGTNGGKLWDQIRGSSYMHNGLGIGYGIGMSIIPNKVGTGALLHGLYLNSLLSSTGRTARLLYNETNRVSVIGGAADGTSTSSYFFGEIQEIIVMSRPAGLTGSVLTELEMKKINTYLAIKYGITLDNGSQKDYVLSNDVVVYDRNAVGYTSYIHDVFGIARDDSSGLIQKQSISSDNAALTVYIGDLAEINDENTSTTLDNGDALMFGANGQTGSSSYNYNSGTAFQNYTLQISTDPITGLVNEERLSTKSNYVLRAKATGKTSFTLNANPGLGQWLLVGTDPNFNPTDTRIYRIVGGKVEGITINDGDYIGFTYYMQAPGGVTNGLRMWLNASADATIATNELGEITSWSDFAGMGTVYRRRPANNASALYVKAEERTNFHPSLLFRKNTDYLITDSGPMSVAAPSNVALYAVVNHNFASDRAYFIGFGAQTVGTNARRPSFGVYQNGTEGRARIGSTGLTNSSINLFNPGATTIAGYNWIRGQNITFEFDGHTNTVSHTSNSAVMNGQGMLGLGSSSNSYYLQGVMPEIIAYEGTLTQDERDRLNSYLGLKYGITLDLNKSSNDVNFDYLFSDGSMVWEGNNAIHKNYHNNIASVLRDDEATLYNRQSRSTNIGSIVHMGVGTKLGVDGDLSNILNDHSSITWGHNNQPVNQFSLVGNPDICGALDSRLNGRVWLVDNMNFNQEILVSAYGSSFPYNGAGYEVYLLVADSPEKIANNDWDQMIPMTFADDMHIVSYNFRNSITYFTFGAKQSFNCEGCDFSGIKNFDFTRTTWDRGEKGPRSFNLGDNFNLTVTVEDFNNVLSNRYPRASTQKTLRENRRRNPGDVVTKIEFKNDLGEGISASTTFELFDIDRQGNILDDVQVIGYCSGSPVYPKMSYAYNRPERSRYTIENDGIVKAKPRGVRYNGNSGYTNKRGRAIVEFENPVEEIRVIYTPRIINSSRSSSYIGIGPMEFYCPAPLPAPSEDGLIFTKQAPVEVKLCDVVDYVFRAVNTNCADKEVQFKDVLPSNMIWVNDSFSTGTDIPEENVSGYGTNTLTVSGLVIPGGSSTYTFRASAIFQDAAPPGAYQNQAQLNYDRLGVQTVLESVDRLTGDPFSITTALASERPKSITTSFTVDKSCFVLDSEIEVNLQIDNPNAFTFSDMYLAFDFESEIFEFVPSSLETSSGLSIGTNQGEEGGLEFDDFTLPSGTSSVKFRIKASADLSDYEIDPETSNPADVSLSFDLFSEGEDDCLESVFVNTNGDIDLPYCTVCYYEAVVGDNGDIESSAGFMAITNLDRTNMNWVGLRGNAFVVLESYTKGFVITRLTTAQIDNLKPIEGMLVYDTTINCIKLYNGNTWGCLTQGCVDE